ncbi:MAG TPA: PAS domain S-box protein [Burkholderiaceae bacterium]|nr:PAS domain S-box protein [Burkholderiaceae bacterium]
MRNPSLSHLTRYAFALAATVVAVLLRWALEPWLVNDVPFITLFAAIVVTAWYGGPGPAILTAAAGFLATEHLFIEPRGSLFAPDSYLEFGLYLLTSGAIIVFLQLVQRRADAERESARAKERQVQEHAAQLRESEERFRLLIEGTQEYAIFMLDPGGHVVSWNGGAERIKGYKASEILGQHFSRFYPPEDIAAGKAQRELQIAQADGKYEEEGWRLRKDGSRFWASVVVTALRDAGGNLRGFSKVTRDLTERKAAEENAHRLLEEEAARRAAERYADVVERQREQLQVTLTSIGDGVITTDAAGRVVMLNPVAESLTGWNTADAAGRPLEEVFRIVNEATRQAVVNPVAKVIELGTIVGLANHTVLVAKDGTERQIDDSAAPIRDTHDRIVGCVLIFRDISARRRTEEALLGHEERLRLATRTGKVGVWEWDIAADRVEWTESLYAIHGVTRTEFDGTVGAFAALVHPEDRDLVNAAIERALASEAPYELEFRAVRPDGAVIWLYTNATVLRAGGRPRRMIGATLDITQRKRVEEQLRDSERTQRLLAEIGALGASTSLPGGTQVGDLIHAIAERVATELQASRCGFLRVDAEKGEMVVEQAVSVGLSPLKGAFAIARHAQHFIEDGKAGRTTVMNDLAADPRTAAKYQAVYRPVGLRAYITVPLRDAGRWVASFWVSSHEARQWSAGEAELMQTVAQRVWLVVQQARAAAALAESEQRFRRMADAAPVMIWVSDTDKQCTWVNKQWLAFVGRSMAQVVGRGWIESIHPDDVALCLDTYTSAFDARRPLAMEYRLRRRDGAYRWVLDNSLPMHGPSGEFTGYIGSCLDITDRREAEETLKEADRRKDAFLATLAHELRNPLAPIRNAAQLLKAKGAEDAQLQWGGDVIGRQVEHMARLLDDLLDVSRISRNRLDLRKERVELATIMQNAIETSRPLIDANSHRLHLDLPRTPIHLDADPVRLAQVFSNLLNNAAKYMEPNGNIFVSAQQCDDEVMVSVRDEGIGIAAEVLPRVFEMFAQASPAPEQYQGGTGIGLSLARGLVELHHGRIEARSEGAGKGAEFVVHLPLARVQASAEPGVAAAAEAQPAEEAKRRLLVVDDLKDSADSLAMLLTLMGHDVHAVYGGEEAVAAAARVQPEVILLDIGMPNVNGYQVCRQIREQPWGKDMTIVALTGWGQEDDRRRTQAAGFDHHLVKPVDPGALTELLASVPPPAN